MVLVVLQIATLQACYGGIQLPPLHSCKPSYDRYIWTFLAGKKREMENQPDAHCVGGQWGISPTGPSMASKNRKTPESSPSLMKNHVPKYEELVLLRTNRKTPEIFTIFDEESCPKI